MARALGQSTFVASIEVPPRSFPKIFLQILSTKTFDFAAEQCFRADKVPSIHSSKLFCLILKAPQQEATRVAMWLCATSCELGQPICTQSLQKRVARLLVAAGALFLQLPCGVGQVLDLNVCG